MRAGERETTEDEMVGWHDQEFEQTPGDGEGQGSLACCGPWGRRVRHNLEHEQQQESQDTWLAGGGGLVAVVTGW